MPTPVWTVNDLPVYATPADLPTDNLEHGDLTATVTPPGFFMWHRPPTNAWVPISSGTTGLDERVNQLEARLACLADCLTQPI